MFAHQMCLQTLFILFIFGLLSGNSNIVKIPNKNFTEKNIALSILKNILNKKIYRIFKETNQFIEYSSKAEITKELSSVCDVRIIWGRRQDN